MTFSFSTAALDTGVFLQIVALFYEHTVEQINNKCREPEAVAFPIIA